ncbi:hypothetical protein IJH19_00900 [Candidatus Saccharibacteria bacterium]|nr:hypothetical protein [Candidatus Saccharibacteria bacterium]
MDNEKGGWMDEGLNEVEQLEKLNEGTFQKMGEIATKAIDLDKVTEEVEDEVLEKENPNAGYETFMEARDLSKGVNSGE